MSQMGVSFSSSSSESESPSARSDFLPDCVAFDLLSDLMCLRRAFVARVTYK